MPKFFDYKYRIRYYKTEEVNAIGDILHPSVRECAKFVGIEEGFEMAHNSDLPAGSGLGSSSTFTVGMLHSLYALKSYMPTKRELAVNALHVEQDLIGEAVGSQDQIAAAWGGFNKITFGSDRKFEVDPIIISRDRLFELQENLILCFTGDARMAAEFAKQQIQETPGRFRELNDMDSLTNQALEILKNNNMEIDDFGRLLADQWKIKKSLTSRISNATIDQIYETGIKNGALGGKLLGAGGGGFMVFYARKSNHSQIMEALSEKLFVPFRFENTGSKIIYFSHE